MLSAETRPTPRSPFAVFGIVAALAVRRFRRRDDAPIAVPPVLVTAGFTLTATNALLQQHSNPPPPSPD